MLVYEFLLAKKCVGEVIKQDNISTNANNDRKYDELKKYIQSKYAISDEEIDDTERRKYTRFTTKDDKLSKIPELGNMIAYILSNPDLLNNPRLHQVLEKFKNSRSSFIDLKSCNMFVHNQYFSAKDTSLEEWANELAPVLDYMCTVISTEE